MKVVIFWVNVFAWIWNDIETFKSIKSPYLRLLHLKRPNEVHPRLSLFGFWIVERILQENERKIEVSRGRKWHKPEDLIRQLRNDEVKSFAPVPTMRSKERNHRWCPSAFVVLPVMVSILLANEKSKTKILASNGWTVRRYSGSLEVLKSIFIQSKSIIASTTDVENVLIG